MIETVGDLIYALNEFDPTTKVIGTWESVGTKVYVYKAKDGTAVVDCDGESYRECWENGEFSTEDCDR